VALSGPRRVLLEYPPEKPVFRVVGPDTTTHLAVHSYKNWLDLPAAVSLSQSGNRVAFSVGQRLRVIEFVGGDTEAMDVAPIKKALSTHTWTNPIATKWFSDRFLGIFYDVNLGGYLKHVVFDFRSRRVIDRKRLPWDAPASKGKWGWTLRGKWRGTVSDKTIKIGLGSYEWSATVP
jgi:hypothetical protein